MKSHVKTVLETEWFTIEEEHFDHIESGLGALVVLLRMLKQGRLHLWSYYLVAVALAFSAWLFYLEHA